MWGPSCEPSVRPARTVLVPAKFEAELIELKRAGTARDRARRLLAAYSREGSLKAVIRCSRASAEPVGIQTLCRVKISLRWRRT